MIDVVETHDMIVLHGRPDMEYKLLKELSKDNHEKMAKRVTDWKEAGCANDGETLPKLKSEIEFAIQTRIMSDFLWTDPGLLNRPGNAGHAAFLAELKTVKTCILSDPNQASREWIATQILWWPAQEHLGRSRSASPGRSGRSTHRSASCSPGRSSVSPGRFY
jgi:hypothetical protein